MQKIRLRFVIKSDVIRVKGIGVPVDFMPADKTVSSIDEVSANLFLIEHNFAAFIGGSPQARSKCAKPDEAGDLNQFPVNPPGSNGPDTVQRKCDPDSELVL